MSEDRDIIAQEDADLWGGDDQLFELHVIDDEIVGIVPIERLAFTSPFEAAPWFDGQGVTLEGVQRHIVGQTLEATPYPGFSYYVTSEWNTERHEARIAYLVQNPSSSPIEVEFIDAEQAILEMQDGWHRLAAALVRGDENISINVGGYFRHAVARLGAICRQYQEIEPPEQEMLQSVDMKI
jgi:hypothetical protein